MKTSQLVKFVRALTLATTVAYAFAAFPATQEINVEANDSQELSSFTSNDIRKTGYGTLVTTGDFSGKFAIGQGVWRIAGGSSVECKQPTNEKENAWYYIYGDDGSDSDPSRKSRIEVTEGSTLYYNLGTGYQYLGLGSRNSYRGYGELVVTDGSTLTVKAETRIMDSGSSYGVGVLAITNSTASFLKLRMAPGGGNVAGKAYFSACNSKVSVQEINCGTKSTISMDFDGVTLTPTKAHTAWITGRDANECLAHIGAGGLTINATYDVTIGDTFPMDGVGGLVKKGTGALTMAASNFYTGDTELQEGVLSLGSIAGDLTVKGGSAIVNGAVGGDVTATAGTISIGAGVSMAGLQCAAEGTVIVTGTGVTIGTLGDFGGKLIIPAGAVTINALAEGAEITGTIECPDANVGDVVLTSASEAVRAAVKANFAARRITLAENENVLTLAPSDFVFDSTEISDLSDPNGWRNGELPPEGASVKVAGNGVKAEITQDSFVRMGVIELADGASLTIKANNTQGKISLGEGTSLVIASDKTLTLDTGIGFVDNLESAAGMASILVNAGATLKIPGGTKFKNVALTLNGSLIGLTDGPFVFGTANVDETAYFAMTANSATITALNGAGTENASRIDFVVPTAGGTVVVTSPIVLTGTTFTYNEKDGFAFGLNNPTDQAFQVVAESTDFEIGAETTVAGAANLVLNGSQLFRKRHSEGDTNESKYNIVVQNHGKITVGEGGSIYAGVTRVNNNLVDGAIRLQPDEAGFVGIEFLDGGVAHWYKVNGYDKGAMGFNDSTFEFTKSYWHGWGNRSHLFNGLTAVNLAEGKTLTFKCVTETVYSSNYDNYTFAMMEAPFTGAGDLFFTSERSGQQMQPTFVSADNTCTGTLSVDSDKNIMVHFARGANWAGTVVLNGKVDLIPQDQDHTSEKANPTSASFGAARLDSDFTLRLWGGETLKNDQINLTQGGWSGEAKLLFALQDGYEAQPTDRWVIGTMPKGTDLPQTSDKWQLITEDLDDALCTVYLQPAATDYNFISNTDGSTNLGDLTAWEGGVVPTGKDVTILGEGVVAEINADQPLPSFTSIELKGGATLCIGAEVANLPPLTVDGLSKVVVKEGGIFTIPASFACSAKEVDSGISLPKLVIEEGATLIIPTGTQFKNVEMDIRGLVKSEGKDGEIIFGAASAGETTYFAFNADGAKFEIPGNQNNGIRTLSFVRPETTGRVKVLGDIVIKDCEFKYWGWADWMSKYIGDRNPTDETFKMIWDGTWLEACYDLTVGGGAQLEFVNGGKLTRGTAFAGMWVDVTVKDAATLTFDGADTGVEMEASVDCNFVINSSGEARDVVTLKNGASFNARRVVGQNGATILVESGTNDFVVGRPQLKDNGEVYQKYRLYEGATVKVAEGAKGRLVSKSSLLGSDVDKEVEFLGVVAGDGDFEIANEVAGKSFSVNLANGSPLFEGMIGIAEGSEATMLRFVDGANWAGTVVWTENVSVSNLTAGATAMTFENIRLASGEFPIRVFKDAKGVLTCDQVNLTGAVVREAGDTGIIRLTGVEPEIGDKISLGTALPGAWAKAVVKTTSGHTVQVIESEPDEHGLVTATLAVPTGFLIIIR